MRLYVLFAGAAVMAVEFGAQRLLEPFFGNSQLVWATLIGLILLGLSIGYALGGRLADRRPSPTWLGLITLGAGVFVAVLPLIAQPLLRAMVHGLLHTPAGVVIASLLGTVLLFLPPVAALGVVSPYAIRLVLKRADLAGSRSGSLYAWSTFGSLIGTFVPTFVTIPDLGVRATLWLSAAMLITIGAVATGRFGLLAAALLPLPLARVASPLLKPVPGLITETETPVQFAEVYRLPSGMIALSVNDGAGYQSVYTPKRLTGLYYDAYLTLPFMFPRRKPLSALLIGMAAGTIPTLYLRDVDPYRAPVRMTGVEIDPKLPQLGRTYFHLKPQAAHVVIADGRVFLEKSKSRYDLMIVDAYSQEIYIPFSLTTREFFALCRAHLRPDGILALNVNATSAHAPLLRAIERTLQTVFPHVTIARAPGAYNRLLLASTRPINPAQANALPSFLRPVAARLRTTWRSPSPGGGLVLTDNRAPVDALTNQMILQKLSGRL